MTRSRWLTLVGLVLCGIGWYKHRPRRAGRMGGFRCEHCQRPFADLDEAGETGNGYARPVRKTYSRGNGGEVTRSSEWPN